MSRHKKCSWSTTPQQRRESAENCQRLRDVLTAEQQLEVIEYRPGFSAKETKRLQAAIVKRDNTPAKRRKTKKASK